MPLAAHVPLQPSILRTSFYVVVVTVFFLSYY